MLEASSDPRSLLGWAPIRKCGGRQQNRSRSRGGASLVPSLLMRRAPLSIAAGCDRKQHTPRKETGYEAKGGA